MSETGRRGHRDRQPGSSYCVNPRPRPQYGCGDVPVTETSLFALLRWGQLEALKKEKEMQLARTTDVCSFLHKCRSTQVQLRDLILRLETLELGQSEDSHCVLQLAQQKMPALERSVYHLQRITIKYRLGSGPGRQGRTEQGCGMRNGTEIGAQAGCAV